MKKEGGERVNWSASIDSRVLKPDILVHNKEGFKK